MRDPKSSIVIWAVVIGSMMIGGGLGVYISGRENGNYNFDMAFAITGGAVLAFIVYMLFSKWNKKRKGNIPDVDERSVLLMQRYLIIAFYIILFGSMAVLLILESINNYFNRLYNGIIYCHWIRAIYNEASMIFLS